MQLFREMLAEGNEVFDRQYILSIAKEKGFSPESLKRWQIEFLQEMGCRPKLCSVSFRYPPTKLGMTYTSSHAVEIADRTRMHFRRIGELLCVDQTHWSAALTRTRKKFRLALKSERNHIHLTYDD